MIELEIKLPLGKNKVGRSVLLNFEQAEALHKIAEVILFNQQLHSVRCQIISQTELWRHHVVGRLQTLSSLSVQNGAGLSTMHYHSDLTDDESINHWLCCSWSRAKQQPTYITLKSVICQHCIPSASIFYYDGIWQWKPIIYGFLVNKESESEPDWSWLVSRLPSGQTAIPYLKTLNDGLLCVGLTVLVIV